MRNVTFEGVIIFFVLRLYSVEPALTAIFEIKRVFNFQFFPSAITRNKFYNIRFSEKDWRKLDSNPQPSSYEPTTRPPRPKGGTSHPLLYFLLAYSDLRREVQCRWNHKKTSTWTFEIKSIFVKLLLREKFFEKKRKRFFFLKKLEDSSKEDKKQMLVEWKCFFIFVSDQSKRIYQRSSAILSFNNRPILPFPVLLNEKQESKFLWLSHIEAIM